MESEDLKNHAIEILVVSILLLTSIIYENSCSLGLPFPFHEKAKVRAANIDIPIFLYVYFSQRNCRDCLEILQVLNDLLPQVIITIVVLEGELEEEKEVKGVTGIAFLLIHFSKYSKRHHLWYTPSIIGDSHNRMNIFSLSGVSGEKDYLESFLKSLYDKTYEYFLNDQVRN
jgi:hypothetical protein